MSRPADDDAADPDTGDHKGRPYGFSSFDSTGCGFVPWEELARHPDRVAIVVDKLVGHFLTHPDPSGLKAQLVAVDRKACAMYKDAIDRTLHDRGLPPETSDVIVSAAQNSEPAVERFEYPKATQDELIKYFKLTPAEWEAWNRERHGEDQSRWRPPLKILIVCDRLLTGFNAPVEQVMYLDRRADAGAYRVHRLPGTRKPRRLERRGDRRSPRTGGANTSLPWS